MPVLTRATLQQKLEFYGLDGSYNLSAGTVKNPSVTVLPYVVLTFTSKSMVRPFVILKVSVNGAIGTPPVWWTNYICAAKEQHALTGSGGWSEDGGTVFRSMVTSTLNIALDVALRDLEGKLPRPSASGTKLKTQWAFLQKELEVQGELIEHTENEIVFAPKIGDMAVFSGINIFYPDLVQLTVGDRMDASGGSSGKGGTAK